MKDPDAGGALVSSHHADLIVTQKPEMYVVYSTAAQVKASLEEVIVEFGERDPDDPARARMFARMYLSLPHAKRLAGSLAKVIELLEADIGLIDPDPAATLVSKRARSASKGQH